MSGYSARKAPNVSQYIANLNTVPSAHDGQPGYPVEDDLAIFTNAEFFDFDLGDNIDSSVTNYDPSVDSSVTPAIKSDTKNLSFNNNAYRFSGLPFIPTDPIATVSPTLDANFADTPFDLSAFGSSSSPFNIPQAPQTGDTRPFSAISQTPTSPSLEPSFRAAAEEDKRRRNTAASARFRVKKKQREQALEKTAKEMTDKADALEARIAQLEMENKWLRNLVVEKTAKGKEDVAELWKRFITENEGRSSDDKKKGVGTSVKDDGDAIEE